MSDYLRMSGLYWSVTFLDLVNSLDKLNKEDVIAYLKRNQHSNGFSKNCFNFFNFKIFNKLKGGFSPCDGHDPHLLYTLSAVQVF